MAIELVGFVVQCHQRHVATRRDLADDRDRPDERLALVEHEGRELFLREGARREEDRAVEILIEREAADLPVADELLMPVLEFLAEVEALVGARALLVVPAIGAEDAADVEEEVSEGHVAVAIFQGSCARSSSRFGCCRSSSRSSAIAVAGS